MSQDWSAPAWAVLAAMLAVVVLGVGLALVARRRSAAARAAIADARAETHVLRTQVEAIERRLVSLREPVAERETQEYKITMLGEKPEVEPAPVMAAPVFADLVLRESAVQAVSFAAGLRRALAPETRNRIRFAMRGEVKRARKQRRLDVRRARQAVRESSAA